jgi:hypothetical protein
MVNILNSSCNSSTITGSLIINEVMAVSCVQCGYSISIFPTSVPGCPLKYSFGDSSGANYTSISVIYYWNPILRLFLLLPTSDVSYVGNYSFKATA